MHLRLATPHDAAAITTIYNQGIEDRIATFETRLRAPQEIEQWFDGVHPIVVLETDERQVIAWARSMRSSPPRVSDPTSPCCGSCAWRSMQVWKARSDWPPHRPECA